MNCPTFSQKSSHAMKKPPQTELFQNRWCIAVLTYMFDAFLQSLWCQSTRTLHSDAIVVGPPAGGVDVDVSVVEA